MSTPLKSTIQTKFNLQILCSQSLYAFRCFARKVFPSFLRCSVQFLLRWCRTHSGSKYQTLHVLEMVTLIHFIGILNLSSSSVGNDYKMHKYSVWCICHVRGRNFYHFEKSSRWAKFTSNSHPTIVTNTNLLNFHFPISNFLRTGGHAQKQIVKKKKMRKT